MYRVGICDDDIGFADKLSQMVQFYCRKEKIQIEIVVYQTGRQLLFKLHDNEYIDVFLLDIEMPGRTGLEIATEIKKYHPNTIIIFITSHVKYAPQSFELSIFRYIPKKFLSEKLADALKDAFNILELQKGKYYLIETSLKNIRLYYSDIVYIYKDGKNSVFVLFSSKVKGIECIRKSISQVYAELNSEEFVFIERGCIINIGSVEKVFNNKIHLTNGEELKVAEAHLQNVKRQVSLFWRKLL